eukprot:g48833.t1
MPKNMHACVRYMGMFCLAVGLWVIVNFDNARLHGSRSLVYTTLIVSFELSVCLEIYSMFKMRMLHMLFCCTNSDRYDHRYSSRLNLLLL